MVCSGADDEGGRTVIDEELFDLAVSYYAQDCEDNGWIYQQPSDVYLADDGDIVLSNAHGELVSYRAESLR